MLSFQGYPIRGGTAAAAATEARPEPDGMPGASADEEPRPARRPDTGGAWWNLRSLAPRRLSGGIDLPYIPFSALLVDNRHVISR